MSTRTHTQKDGTIWEWEETPSFQKAIKEFRAKTKENSSKEDQST